MNQQGMKAENKKRIFNVISENPGISRVTIAKQCRFSKTTVSMLVDELIRDGYVRDGGLAADSNTGQGRKPSSLYLNKQHHCIVAVNWCKRYVQIAKADLACGIHNVYTLKEQAGEMVQHLLIDAIRSFIEAECKECEVMAICFILPAMIDESSGEVISAVLSEEQTCQLIPNLKASLKDYPLVFFNDTACLAYAEKNFGSEEALDDFVYVNLNEGIGAAFVLDGGILGGAGGIATQFGHFSIDRKGDQCVCGGHGCLETRVGEQALAKRVKECDAVGLLPDGHQIQFCDLGTLAAKGNVEAMRVIDVLADDLGYALGNLVTLLNVKRILLGGFGRNLGDYFLKQVRKAVKGVGFQMFVQHSVIEYAALDEDALLSGAARYFMDYYFELNECVE